MNKKAVNFIKNFIYTSTSNLITLIISAIVTLIVPKLVGVEEYGYFQLYILYTTYVGILHFGWADGIYLRYGGKRYNELDKDLFFSQFYMLVILQIILLFIILTISNLFITSVNQLFILSMGAVSMFLTNTSQMLKYILLGTNRMKEYAKTVMLNRILYICIILIFVFVGMTEYKYMIFADLIGIGFSLVYAMYCCKDIVIKKISLFRFRFKEATDNIRAGIKLIFANIAGMLIIGIVRFGIERSWGVSTFAKVTLTLSISNFLTIFINAVSLVIFPILRRVDRKILPDIYGTIRDLLDVMMLGFLILYYPFKELLSAWLPSYADGLGYMAILFPLCIFEGKMSLLITTYLKTLRKERVILVVNIITLLASILLTAINMMLIKNLNLAILSILILITIRCIFAEISLSNTIRISIFKDIALEVVMTCIFIISTLTFNILISIVVYLSSYFVYIIIKRRDIEHALTNLKGLLHE